MTAETSNNNGLTNNKLTEIRILKEASCPSLSERSTLIYHIGCNERNDLLFKIISNSSSGNFNHEWFFAGDMLELIYESKKPFSWKVLYPLLKGKSVNTACFLLAALKNEGLLTPLDRKYEQKSSAEFQDRMKKLMAAKKPKKAKATKSQSKKKKGAES